MANPLNPSGTALSWTQAGGLVTLIEGSTFCICTNAGDILPGAAQGFFRRDARLLSRWELLADGQQTEPLSVQPTDPYAGEFVCRPHPRAGQPETTVSVVRRRAVGKGMQEEIRVRNYGLEATTLTLTLAVEADFAHIFAVKEGRPTPTAAQRVDTDDHQLGIWPTDDPQGMGVLVRTRECATPIATPGALTFPVVVPTGDEWHACVDVLAVRVGEEPPPPLACGERVEHASAARRLTTWREGTTRIETDHPVLSRALRRAENDLGSLLLFDPDRTELSPTVAAGAPWFMTLFGRDSLLTSWMALPLDPRLAVGTLHHLAARQGTKVDLRTEEQPGRILHEVRHGSQFQLWPATAPGTSGADSVYYGSIDSTPLFVMLCGELCRWGLVDEVRPLLPAVDRALAWIDEYGDRDGDGFVEYRRTTDSGILNQGWKDSFDGVSFHDGRLAEPPVALCEVQGYVYGAFRARATIARAEGDDEGAAAWDQRAEKLRRAFHEAFWLPERGYFALALDREKRPVDALASNMGHCLWTGIVDDDPARQVADHLLSDPVFNGWGVRTLTSAAGRYNPVSYHNGSVWPHDTAIAVAGLARYGFTEHAARVVTGVLAAAERLGGRLPELFCGYGQDEYAAPVAYPSSCSPQAWSAASTLLLLRALLRLEPDVPGGELRLAPWPLPGLRTLRLDRLALGADRVTVSVEDDRVSIDGLPPTLHLTTG